MRSKDEVLRDLEDLDRQEQSLGAEIQSKERELAEAKASNQALLKKYLGASKRPMSLTVQAEKIKNLATEIGQLREMAPLFEQKRSQLKHEAGLVDLAADLSGYRENARKFFEKTDEAMKLLGGAVDVGKKLGAIVDELRGENPISQLSGILRRVRDLEEMEAIGFDLGELRGYHFLNDVALLEKGLAPLVKAAKAFSDLGFGLDFVSIKNLPIPERRVHPAVEYDRQVGTSGHFDQDTWQGRRLNQQSAAL